MNVEADKSTPSPKTPGLAKATVVLGILSWLSVGIIGWFCLLTGALSIIRIHNTSNSRKGLGVAILGMSLGAAGMIVMPLLLLQHLRYEQWKLDSDQKLRAVTFDSLQDLRQRNYAQYPETLSWRYWILGDYLDYRELYNSFDRNADWNSSKNRPYSEMSLEIYRSPFQIGKGNLTVYQRVVGADTFNAREPGTAKDNLSHWAHIVETDESAATPWAKPQDWHFDPSDPKRDLGNLQANGFLTGFADGSVRFMNKDIDPDIWKAMCTLQVDSTSTKNSYRPTEKIEIPFCHDSTKKRCSVNSATPFSLFLSLLSVKPRQSAS
jgi:hypothetical protein